MNALDTARVDQFRDQIRELAHDLDLPGLASDAEIDSFAWNIVQSLRRERYPRLLAQRLQSPRTADPASRLFDPWRGAVALRQAGQFDEAFWVLFLATNFGKSGRTGWELLRAVYGRLGEGRWDWASVAADPQEFVAWHDGAEEAIRATGGRYGNHRKRERIAFTPRVVTSYVEWIGHRSHHDAIAPPPPSCVDPQARFAEAYASMGRVFRFGRLGRFDFLSMAGKLGLADVRPGHAYLHGASGPLMGARLLFTGGTGRAAGVDELSAAASLLADRLGIGFDPLEDALCNWQKHPDRFVSFTG